jgi:hypothetical protein
MTTAARIRHTVYKGHNSPLLIDILDVEGNAYTTEKMAAISRVYLRYQASETDDPQYADSEIHTAVFNWSTYASSGQILFDLGLLSLIAGKDRKSELIIYDSDWPEGRVVAQISITVSEEAYGDIELAEALSMISGVRSGPIYSDEDLELSLSDLNKSIIISSSEDRNVLLPSVGESQDGYITTLIKIGTGDLTCVASDDDKIASSEHSSITGSGAYATITLQYAHSILTWVVISSSGSWEGI